MSTSIQWCDETWNPVTGCRKVSAGCAHCYAATWAARQMGQWKGRAFEDVRTHPDRLAVPLHWRKSRRVFVNSMSDLFHDDVPDEFIGRVFLVMDLAPRHTFIVLTKRPRRMREIVKRLGDMHVEDADGYAIELGELPLRNVILGVSVEDQKTADERIPLLLDTPAACRAVSYEPALGAVDFGGHGRMGGAYWLTERPCFVCRVEDDTGQARGSMSHPINCGWRKDIGDAPGGIDWIIVGGESGPGARPFDVGWARSTVKQCAAAGLACFVKQLGAVPMDTTAHGYMAGVKCDEFNVRYHLKDRKGGDIDEWPESIRVRQWPAP